MSGSKCPVCGEQNDTSKDRKHRFSVWQLLGFYIPFYSKDIVEFKFITCRFCGAEYKEKGVRMFGLGPLQEKLFFLAIALLFVLMILTAMGVV